MAKLNKRIISPVIKAGQGLVFHVSGQNFKSDRHHIEQETLMLRF